MGRAHLEPRDEPLQRLIRPGFGKPPIDGCGRTAYDRPGDAGDDVPIEEFQIASTEVAAQAFENHQERTVSGKWVATDRPIAAGWFRVPMTQPLARLAFYLLEPRSNDGLATWNVLDEAIKTSQYPVVRTRN